MSKTAQGTKNALPHIKSRDMLRNVVTYKRFTPPQCCTITSLLDSQFLSADAYAAVSAYFFYLFALALALAGGPPTTINSSIAKLLVLTPA